MAEEYGFTCTNCGEERGDDELGATVHGDEYCDECVHRCDACGEAHTADSPSLEWTPGGDPMCRDCYMEHFDECGDCGAVMDRDYLTYVDRRDCYFCEYCFDERCGAPGDPTRGMRCPCGETRHHFDEDAERYVCEHRHDPKTGEAPAPIPAPKLHRDDETANDMLDARFSNRGIYHTRATARFA